jgi:hypothetical protein
MFIMDRNYADKMASDISSAKPEDAMPYAKTSLRKEKRDLRDKMRGLGLGYRDIAAEFARRYNNRPRAAWRDAYGWSLQETADRVNAFRGQVGLDPGGFAGMTASHLCEYENWPGHGRTPSGRRPTPYLLAVLAAVYDCAVTDLIDLADREYLPPADLLILDKYTNRSRAMGQPVARPAPQIPGSLSQERLGDPRVADLVDQVELLPHRPSSARLEEPMAVASADDGETELTGSHYEASRHPMSAATLSSTLRLPLRGLRDQAAELGAWAEAGTAGPGTIAALDDEVTRVTASYGALAAGPLILRALDACRRASGLLREHQRLRHTRDLHVVAARCCAFLAVALGDIGYQTEASAYARTAMMLAEESADPGAVALACSALSKVAFWDGQHQKSADLAARGLATARVADPLRVLLACQQADASPIPVARDAIELARVAHEETSSGGAEGGLFSCGRVRIAGYAATLGLREGSLTVVLAALAAAEDAVMEGEQAPYASLAQVRLVAALALLASGDADQAAERLVPVLRLPPEMRLATFTDRLSQCAALASAAPYKGSAPARAIAQDVKEYLGGDPVAMPHPLVIGSGSVR